MSNDSIVKQNGVQLIECFYTYQGEGPFRGISMLMLRFKNCNRVIEGKACRWCDTHVKMRISVESFYTFDNLQEMIDNKKCGLMITGGEPTYKYNYFQTIDLLNNLDFSIANVETNGYALEKIVKDVYKDNVYYIYSPKMFTIEEFKEVKNKIKLLENEIRNKKVFLKFVCDNSTIYLGDILLFINDLNLNDSTYLMPEGKNLASLIENSSKTMDFCELYNVNFSSRDHIIFNFI